MATYFKENALCFKDVIFFKKGISSFLLLSHLYSVRFFKICEVRLATTALITGELRPFGFETDFRETGVVSFSFYH